MRDREAEHFSSRHNEKLPNTENRLQSRKDSTGNGGPREAVFGVVQNYRVASDVADIPEPGVSQFIVQRRFRRERMEVSLADVREPDPAKSATNAGRIHPAPGRFRRLSL